jgi:hypothetical protein
VSYLYRVHLPKSNHWDDDEGWAERLTTSKDDYYSPKRGIYEPTDDLFGNNGVNNQNIPVGSEVHDIPIELL